VSNRAPDKHYRLGPSGSSRWLNCPFSAVDDLPSTQNVHTIRGHLLHDKTAHALVDGLPIFGTDPDSDAVRHCVAAAEALPGERHIEVPIVSEEIADFGGTVDVLTIEGDRIHILDHKFGKYRVHAKDNTQLLCYLVLAHEKHPHATEFAATIAQPAVRKKPVTAEYTLDDLKKHKDAVAEAAVSDHKAAGEWCRFCPLLETCEEGQKIFPLRY
jgi:hypothetical protein